MKRQLQWCGAALLVVSLVGSTAVAQRPPYGGGGGTGGGTGGPRKPQVKPPEDQRLYELHMQFVKRAEKLGAQYVQNKELDKAIVCYQEILRLVPSYAPAQAAMAKIFNKQVTAQKVVFDCLATKGWQDTGVDIVAGKPLVIMSKGSWKLRMEYPVSADGIEIPKELRRFNLGSLIGIIIPAGESLSPKLEAPPESSEEAKPAQSQPAAEGEAAAQPAAPEQEQQQADDDDNDAPPAAAPQGTEPPAASGGEQRPPFSDRQSSDPDDNKPRPFYIGKQAELVPSKSGRLFVRIYDADPDDNVGKVTIQINGTFGSATAGASGRAGK